MPSSARAGKHSRATTLQSRPPLVVMPTPASTASSTASTASTAALDSPSGSSDCDTSVHEQEQSRLLQHNQRNQHQHQHRAQDSKSKRSMAEQSTAHAGARKSSSTRKHHSQPPSRSSHKQQQQQYDRARLDDLECGGESTERDDTDASHEWQVVHDFSHYVSSSASESDHALQLVHLRHANYGLRWQQRNGAATAPMCVVGPHWWLMASTFAVFTVAASVITVLTAPQAGAGESLTGILLSGACLTMYALVGIDVPLDDTYSYCDECASYRPEGALHCMDCRACIAGYDHHCPWTGKCVGKRNVRYFYAWLGFLVLAFVYEVIEFTTYVLPPDDQPVPTFYDDDDSSASSVPRLLRVPSVPSGV